MSLAKIGNKIFSKEVELSSEAVELALVDDLKKLVSAADSELDNYKTTEEEFEKVKRAAKVNSKQAGATIKVVAKALDSFNAKAKDLGVNARDVKEYKELSQKFSDLTVIVSEYNTKFK